jgi:hypothetical protein
MRHKVIVNEFRIMTGPKPEAALLEGKDMRLGRRYLPIGTSFVRQEFDNFPRNGAIRRCHLCFQDAWNLWTGTWLLRSGRDNRPMCLCLRDQKDQLFLDLARSGKSECLISADRDLLALAGKKDFLASAENASTNDS